MNNDFYSSLESLFDNLGLATGHIKLMHWDLNSIKIYLVIYVSSMYMPNFQFSNITRILGYELPLCQHGIMEVNRNQWIPAVSNPKSLYVLCVKVSESSI